MKTFKLGLVVTTLVVAVAGLLAVAAEFWLRKQNPDLVGLYTTDKYAVARFKPGLERIRNVRGRGILLQTNSFGVRDDSELDPADADIVVLGDSNVAALFIPFSETLGERLSARLGNNLSATNLALPAYGPDQAANRFIAIADNSRASAVILHFFADNDFGDLLRNNIYRRNESGEWVMRENLDREPILLWNKYQLVQRLWDLLDLEEQQFATLIAGEEYYHPLSYRMGGTVIQSKRKNALEAWKKVTGIEHKQYTRDGRTAWLGDHYDYGMSSDPKGDAAQEAKSILTHVLSLTAASFQGKPACFVLLIQPAEDDLMDTGGASVSRLQLQARSESYYPRALTDLAVEAATAAGVNYIDLFPVFESTPNEYYYSERERPGDNHWNEKGIDTAAALLAAYLEDNGCVEIRD